MIYAYALDPGTVDFGARFRNSVAWDEKALRDEPSTYLAGYRWFPYEWGARYLWFSFQADGLDGVLARYASPPLTTRTLMASVDAALDDLGPPAELPSPVPPSEWAPFTDTTLGAFGVFLVLLHATQAVEEARTLALGWRGDRLSVLAGTTDDAPTAAVLAIEFSDAATAATVTLRFAAFRSARVQRTDARVVMAVATTSTPLDWAFSP